MVAKVKTWVAVLALGAALVATAGPALDEGAADDDAAIREVIEKAYVQGIHRDQDAAAVRAGFHPEFMMFVQADGGVRQVKLEDWIARFQPPAADAPKPDVRAEISVLDRAGSAAVAKVVLYRDGKHIFTDYMSLYRFEGGWKIVAKTFFRH